MTIREPRLANDQPNYSQRLVWVSTSVFVRFLKLTDSPTMPGEAAEIRVKFKEVEQLSMRHFLPQDEAELEGATYNSAEHISRERRVSVGAHSNGMRFMHKQTQWLLVF